MARKIELTAEDEKRIKTENEKKRRSLFDLHYNTNADNNIPDNTIEKIGEKLKLLKSSNTPVIYPDYSDLEKLSVKESNITDNMSEPQTQITDKMSLIIKENNYITDKMSDTDKLSDSDKMSEIIKNDKFITDNMSESLVLDTDKMSEIDVLGSDILSVYSQYGLSNFRGYPLSDEIKLLMILDININTDLSFSARNFLTILILFSSHTWFDVSVHKFLKIIKLEERTFYRFKNDIEKICHIEIMNKLTVFNFIDIYLKVTEKHQNLTEKDTDILSVMSCVSKLVLFKENKNLLTKENFGKNSKSETEHKIKNASFKPSAFLSEIATTDFLKKILLVPGFDSESYYSKNVIKQINNYQTDHIHEPDKDLNLLALCLYSKEKCVKKQTIYNYVFSSLKKGAMDSLINNYKEKAKPYNEVSFDNLDSKSIIELKEMCKICHINADGSWGDLEKRLQEKKNEINLLVEKLMSL